MTTSVPFRTMSQRVNGRFRAIVYLIVAVSDLSCGGAADSDASRRNASDVGGATSGEVDASSTGGVGSANGGSAAGSSNWASMAGALGGLAGGTPLGVSSMQTGYAHVGTSAGFSGSYESDYYPVYSKACSAHADCLATCVTAGGTEQSCSAAKCIDSTSDYCLPPTYWFGLENLRIEAEPADTGAWTILDSTKYRDQLLATDFQFAIPSSATITGIVVQIRKSAESSMAADQEIRLLRNGATVGLDHSKSDPWPSGLEYVEYGTPTDLWGASWTPSDLSSQQFGVAITARYLDIGGNARAYVDFVKATVYYDE